MSNKFISASKVKSYKQKISNQIMTEHILDRPVPEINVPILAPVKNVNTTTKTVNVEAVQEKMT